MKTKLIITTVLILSIFSLTHAQQNKEEKSAKRIAFITERLELSVEESKMFWPIFEQRNNEKRAKIKPLRTEKKRRKMEEMTDSEVESMLENILKIRQIDLDIQKKYHRKFLDVLPPKKVAKLYHIEKRFREHRKGKRKDKNKGNKPMRE